MARTLIHNRTLRHADARLEQQIRSDITTAIALALAFLFGSGGKPAETGHSGAEPRGLLNSYQGYIIAGAVDAFGILLMKQAFETIPKELEEAAMVDGANRFAIFFQIVLPVATPALTALTIFSFQGSWNDFMNALVILGGNTSLYNLPLGLTVLRGSGQDIQYDLVLAGSVITTIPMALIFLFFQKYFVEGISYSGLKG